MSNRLNIEKFNKMLVNLSKLDKNLYNLEESIIERRLRINNLFWKIIKLREADLGQTKIVFK